MLEVGVHFHLEEKGGRGRSVVEEIVVEEMGGRSVG
jgi:hypothetical protein